MSVAARWAPSMAAVDEPLDVGLAARQLALQKAKTAHDDGEHVVEVVGDAAGELPDRLHLLDLAELLLDLGAGVDFVENPLLERVVQNLQRFFGPAALRHLALRRLVQTGVVDGRGGLAGNANQKLLVLLDKLARLVVPEEKSADHPAGSRGDRHGEIAPHRQMSFRHPVMGIALAVTGVFADVIGADDASAPEGRLEHSRVAGHGKLVEVLPRHAREGVEHVALAPVVDHVVEEGAELSFHDLGAGVGHDLHDLVHVELGRKRCARAVQDIELARLGADRLLGLVLLGDIVALDEDAGGRAIIGHDRLVDEIEIALDESAIRTVSAN